MKQIGVLFGDTQPLKAADLSEVVGLNKSDVIRAALHIGMAKIEIVAARSVQDAKDLIVVEDAKCRQ
jgi:hypothetical protein